MFIIVLHKSYNDKEVGTAVDHVRLLRPPERGDGLSTLPSNIYIPIASLLHLILISKKDPWTSAFLENMSVAVTMPISY